MLWLGGTQSGNIQGVGVSLTGGIGSFSGVTNQQSYLAERVAPPPPPAFHLVRYGCLLPIGVTILWIILNILLSRFFWLQLPAELYSSLKTLHRLILAAGYLACLVGPVIWRLIHYPREKANLLRRHEEWKRSWLCLQCGRSWMV